MKGLMKILFLFSILAIVSCGDDACIQDDWVGTFEGTIDCDGTVEDVTVTITASGTDAVRVVTIAGNATTSYDPITVVDCSGENSGTFGSVSASVMISLDGDEFKLEDVTMGGAFDQTCSLTATRMN